MLATVELEDPVVVEMWARMFKDDGTSITDHHSMTVPSNVTLHSGKGRIRQNWFVADGWWSPIYTIVAETSSKHIDLLLYPTSSLIGKIEVPRGEDPPKTLQIRFEQAAGTSSSFPIPRDKIVCTLEKNRFDCDVPAGYLDLRLRAEGFVARYLWNTHLRRGESKDLGTLTLVPGSSVVGRVEASAREGAAGGARVSLRVHQASRAGSADLRSRIQRKSLETVTDRNGFFQITGVPPGEYRVQATKEETGEGEIGPVRVFPGKETSVTRPVLLRPPATIEAIVSPPTDPSSKSWKLELLELGNARAGRYAFKRVQGEGGSWRVQGVRHGRYLLTVRDAFGSTWFSEQVEVDGTAKTIPINMEFVAVEGRVQVEEHPTASVLWFGGERGSPRIQMEADETGFFSGLLPRPGAWRLDLSTEDPACTVRLAEVEVGYPKGEEVVTLDLDLAPTKLVGKIIDQKGKGVPGFALLSGSGGIPNQEPTDSEGSFSYGCMQPGTYYIQAYTQRGTVASERVEFQIEKDKEPGFLELEIQTGPRLEGKVVSDWGGVAGAHVVMTSVGEGGVGQTFIVPETQTDADGSFAFTLPVVVTEVDLLVAAPGYGLKVVRRPIPQSGTPLIVPVFPQAGTLTLNVGETENLASLAREIHIEQNGVALPAHRLQAWHRLYGSEAASEGGMRIPMLEPGEYSFCETSGTEPRCVTDVLQAFAEVEFDRTTLERR